MKQSKIFVNDGLKDLRRLAILLIGFSLAGIVILFYQEEQDLTI